MLAALFCLGTAWSGNYDRYFSADPQVIQAGIPFFRSCSLDYLAVALLFSLNGYLNGCEKTLFTMTNCCAGALLIRIPLLHFLTGQGIRQLQAYGLVSPCSSLVMIGVILLLPHLAGKKEKKPRFLCFVAPVIQKDKDNDPLGSSLGRNTESSVGIVYQKLGNFPAYTQIFVR